MVWNFPQQDMLSLAPFSSNKKLTEINSKVGKYEHEEAEGNLVQIYLEHDIAERLL